MSRFLRTNKAVTTATALTAAAAAGWYFYARQRPDPSPFAYGPAVVTRSLPHDTASDTRRLMLTLPAPTMALVQQSAVPFHFDVKNTDLVVARSYTPVAVNPAERTVELLVKKYPIGETGKWMHRQQAGAEMEVCGPLCEWAIPAPPPTAAETAILGMIVGGSGATPALQILDAALGNPEAYPVAHAALAAWPKFSLLYFARTPADHWERAALDKLAAKYPERLQVKYVTSHEALTPELIQATMPSPGQGLVLVCGPDGLVRTTAGGLGRVYGTQGPLGGLLLALGYNAAEVHKMQ
ncbi:hypothetical protein BC828DRAFT_375216 [Blastocladiella britannica]|nr:hypothetical protein BC828DRAFT_375216 [Blastocladiella britannica]